MSLNEPNQQNERDRINRSINRTQRNKDWGLSGGYGKSREVWGFDCLAKGAGTEQGDLRNGMGGCFFKDYGLREQSRKSSVLFFSLSPAASVLFFPNRPDGPDRPIILPWTRFKPFILFFKTWPQNLRSPRIYSWCPAPIDILFPAMFGILPIVAIRKSSFWNSPRTEVAGYGGYLRRRSVMARASWITWLHRIIFVSCCTILQAGNVFQEQFNWLRAERDRSSIKENAAKERFGKTVTMRLQLNPINIWSNAWCISISTWSVQGL